MCAVSIRHKTDGGRTADYEFPFAQRNGRRTFLISLNSLKEERSRLEVYVDCKPVSAVDAGTLADEDAGIYLPMNDFLRHTQLILVRINTKKT